MVNSTLVITMFHIDQIWFYCSINYAISEYFPIMSQEIENGRKHKTIDYRLQKIQIETH